MVEITNTTSQLGEILGILNNLGFFNIILPMVLIYAMVLGILEQTAIFKTTKLVDGRQQTVVNKNVNAAIAFSLSLISVASANIVGAITNLSSYLVLFIFIIVYGSLIFATLKSSGDSKLDIFENKNFKKFLVFSIFVIGLIIVGTVIQINEKTLLSRVYDSLRGYLAVLIIGGFFLGIYLFSKR